MDPVIQQLSVSRGTHRMYAELAPGPGIPVVLMHGFPDNVHLYDRLLPHLEGKRPVVRFDFLGWGRSEKPDGYPYTATNQVGDIDAVVAEIGAHVETEKLVLVAHDASGPPAIDWALAHPQRIAMLVLLNTYYHWTPALRRPPAIALYSTPFVRTALRRLIARRPDLNRRLYEWQVGIFIRDAEIRDQLVPLLYSEFVAALPAFLRLNDDLLPTVFNRRQRLAQLRRFEPPVRIVFGARDRDLNPRVALNFAELFPHNELTLIHEAGHFVQVDEPEAVADLILRQV